MAKESATDAIVHARSKKGGAPRLSEVWNIKRIQIEEQLRNAVPGDPEGRKALLESIEKNGCDDPLDVTPEGVLVDGHGRYEGAKKSGLKKVPVTVHKEWKGLSIDALIEESFRRNVETRRHLSEAQMVRVAAKLEKLERVRAAERKLKGQKKGGSAKGKGKLGGKSPREQKDSIRALDLLGRRLGMSGKTYRKAKAVLEAGDADEAPVAQLYEKGLIAADLAHNVIVKTQIPKDDQATIVKEVVEGGDQDTKRRLARKLLRDMLHDKGTRKPTNGLGTVRAWIAGLARSETKVTREEAEALTAEDRLALLEQVAAAKAQLADFERILETTARAEPPAALTAAPDVLTPIDAPVVPAAR